MPPIDPHPSPIRRCCRGAARLALAIGVMAPVHAAPQGAASRLGTIATSTDATLSVPRVPGSAIVRTRSGSLFVLVDARRDGPTPLRRTTLHRSDDGGRTFAVAAELDPSGTGHGRTLAVDATRDVVHIAWQADVGTGGTSVFWQVFDPATSAFVAPAVRVVTGTGADDQYLAEGLVVAADGTVVLAISAHRSPPNGWASWSSALLVRRVDALEFEPPRRINVGYTGVTPALALDGDVVHATFRAGNASFGIHLRSFDLTANSWRTDDDIPVSYGDRTDGLQSGNTSSLVIDGNGDLSVAYAVARDSSESVGPLELAFARRAAPTTWRRVVVDDAVALGGGNANSRNFALSRSAGEHVVAIWSKPGESYRTLYTRTFAAGVPLGPPRTVAAGGDGAFAEVSGVRADGLDGLVLAVVSGTADVEGATRAAVLGRMPPPRREPPVVPATGTPVRGRTP